MGEVNETPTQARRRDGLKSVLEEQFGGRQADLARAIGVADAYLWQLVNGKRPIGELVASRIEIALGLPEGGLAVIATASAPLAEAAELLPPAAQDELHQFLEVLTTQHATQLGPAATRNVLNLLEKAKKRRSR